MKTSLSLQSALRISVTVFALLAVPGVALSADPPRPTIRLNFFARLFSHKSERTTQPVTQSSRPGTEVAMMQMNPDQGQQVMSIYSTSGQTRQVIQVNAPSQTRPGAPDRYEQVPVSSGAVPSRQWDGAVVTSTSGNPILQAAYGPTPKISTTSYLPSESQGAIQTELASQSAAPSESAAPTPPAAKVFPTATFLSYGRVKLPFAPYSTLDVDGLPSGSLAKDPVSGQIFRVP